jgi:hypothetical protein
MIQRFFKQNWIHFVAVALFFLAIYVFMTPAFQGKVLNQHDTTGWRATAHNAMEYGKTHGGQVPLWNPNVFSGMPNYTIASGGGKSILPNLGIFLSLGMPEPAGFFVLAAICFYIMACCFGINRWIGIIGALIYSLCTYNMVIVAAGHQTKMIAMAFLPGVIGSMKLLFDKKYALGLIASLFFFTMELIANHVQITYYLVFMAGIFYIYHALTTKDYKGLAISTACIIAAATSAILINAGNLMVTSEYSKFTMRGGAAVTINEKGIAKDSISKGLSTNYAFEYSHGKAELLTFLMPNAFGGRTPDQYDPAGSEGDVIGTDAKVMEKIDNIDEDKLPAQYKEGLKQQLANMPKYWGQIGITNGPWYASSIVFLLAILSLALPVSKHKWWLWATILFSCILAMGGNLASINTSLFNAIPYLNKFRAPATALFLTQLSLVSLAMLTLHYLSTVLVQKNNDDTLTATLENNALSGLREKDILKRVAIAFGALLVFIIGYYVMGDFGTDTDKQIIDGLKRENDTSVGRAVVRGLIEDRKVMFISGIGSVLFYIALIACAIYAIIKKIMNPLIPIGILGCIAVLNVGITSAKYLSKERFKEKEEYNKEAFAATAADNFILNDKDPNYRVFDLTAGAFSDARPSYFHKNVGGYSPAKLRIYQDVIEAYLRQPGENMNVLNMLNAKYIVTQGQDNKPMPPQLNPTALGNAWIVKHVKVAKSPADELMQLKGLNTKDTAVVSNEDAAKIAGFTTDTSAKIKMIRFEPDSIQYESTSAVNAFAVFSEVYYPKGWNAYIDGKLTPISKTNYVLRGLVVPAGKHTIRFVFEPETWKKGQQFSLYGSILFYIILIGALGWLIYSKRKKTTV